MYGAEEIVVSRDWAFDRGTYRVVLTPKTGGAPISESGKYLWLYRRHPDGSWKQSRVMWNSSDPRPTGGVGPAAAVERGVFLQAREKASDAELVHHSAERHGSGRQAAGPGAE